MPEKRKKPQAANLNDPLYPPRFEDMKDPKGAGLHLEAAGGPDYGQILETICGVEDDSQPVEQYDGSLGVTTQFVLDHQEPVAQVQWNNNLRSKYANAGNVSGARFGTGAMISADLFLTCAHLFRGDASGWLVPRQPGTDMAITHVEIATNMHLNFNYQVDPSGTLRPTEEFAITELVEFERGGLDMAICRVANSPGNRFGFLKINTVDAEIGHMLTIIGHPAGTPKRIEAGPLTSVAGNYLTYNDIDTLGGNSGSPIISARTGRVVGVHTNGGCTASSPAGGGANSGVAIGRIRAASPTIQSLPDGRIHTVRADDQIFSLKAQDDPQIGTRYARDTRAAQDQPHTLRALDNIGTLQSQDGPFTLYAEDQKGTLLARDVNTAHVRDLRQTIGGENIKDPGGGLVDPVRGLRPFVQAGAFQQIDAAQGGVEEIAETSGAELLASSIADLEAVIAAQHESLAALEGVWTALTTLLEGESQ